MGKLRWLVALGVTGLIAAWAPLLGSQASDGPDPASASVGTKLYETYCSSCHGETGLGDGALAEHLRAAPANLTELSKRNGGVFPFALVARVIDGRKPVSGHGGADMPAWGDAFEKSAGGLSEKEVQLRIHSVVHFLWSIQKAEG
jgi:mono/diheme cytochrome c family protein